MALVEGFCTWYEFSAVVKGFLNQCWDLDVAPDVTVT